MNLLRQWVADLNPQVTVVSLMTLVMMMGSSVISPVLPLIAQDFGVSYAGAGALVSAFALGRIPFDFIGGGLIDRLSPRWIAAGGAAVVAVSAWLSAIVQDFHVLLLCRFVGGAGSALFTITAMACLARTVAPQRMGQAMSFYQSMLLIGVSFGPSVGGVAASFFHNLRAPFWAMAVLSLAVAVMSSRWVGDFSPATELSYAEKTFPEAPSLLRQLRSDFTFVFICGVTLLLFAIRSGVTLNLMPLFAQETLGLGENGIGLAQSFGSLANFCVLWHAGRILDRAGRRRALLGSLWASALAVLCFPLATTSWLLFLAAILFGAAIGYVGPAPAAVIADLTPPSVVGKVMGVYRGAGDIGLLLGPIAVGWAASHLGFQAAFLAVAACTALVALMGIGMRETLVDIKRDT